ncbi:GNAT family N-acetyltransferase [Nocardia carnea]|uniref:GNAT family N-acetyltransferase n=1 Tax=Nocardia carnea TaxID=37328 RepID=UPI00245796E4|nr:GNAT family N-acetyltransferase [Nocardia carnea]
MLSVTGNLLLRPWKPADAPAFFSAYQDGEIRRWHTRRPLAEAQVLEWFATYDQDWRQEKGGHWAVTRGRGEVLGRIALRDLDFDDGTGDIAYWVLPHARGAGVASRALSALTTWALDEIGFQRLQLDHSTHNFASCRVAEDRLSPRRHQAQRRRARRRPTRHAPTRPHPRRPPLTGSHRHLAFVTFTEPGDVLMRFAADASCAAPPDSMRFTQFNVLAGFVWPRTISRPQCEK